ncbi:MAG: nucleoside-triphosphatase [Bacteroidota bacterium]
MIYILTGDIRTGKTTALHQWALRRDDVDGILSPDYHDKRCFVKLRSQQRFALEVKNPSESETVIRVGRFHFLKNAFTEANSYILSIWKKRTYRYLIIDELGKLELKNTGLHHAAKTVIKTHESDEQHHIVLVVRSSLLHEILAHYTITRFQWLEKAALGTLQ